MTPVRPGLDAAHRASSAHYHTFGVTPPKNRGRPPSSSPSSHRENGGIGGGSGRRDTPLPKRQLAVLAVIALSEQTAFNSISPYLPQMTASFPGVGHDQVGLYVGLIATAFALAQLITNFFWGWLSDKIGRKPVILIGTLFTAACFLAFGFCRTLWQAILVQALLGVVNGNQGIVSTCLGEITDRSNQSQAFVYLPVIYSLGAITGPAVGGLLESRFFPDYPYLAPNLLSSAVLLVDLVITMIFLEESLEEAKRLPPLSKRIGELFSWVWQFAASSTRPSYLKVLQRNRHHSGGNDPSDSDDASSEESNAPPNFFPEHRHELSAKQFLTRDTVLLLSTYAIFQLSNVAYNSLYPIFAEGSPPTGRDLSPTDVGVSLSFAGLATIVFQICVFNRLRSKMGNKGSYRSGLAGFALVFFLMPWVGYKDGGGRAWLWAELGVILLIKTIATVGGLTSALLLITNSAPDHAVLGALNGLAQTLSALGRAIGPFVSGGLFTLATKVEKGEALAFGVFGGVALIGFMGSFGIRSPDLEAEPEEEEGSDDDENTALMGS